MNSGTSLLGTLWDLDFSPYYRGSSGSIQRSFNTLQYYTGTQNGVLITEVPAIQRFVKESFHCIYTLNFYADFHIIRYTCRKVHMSLYFPRV